MYPSSSSSSSLLLLLLRITSYLLIILLIFHNVNGELATIQRYIGINRNKKGTKRFTKWLKKYGFKLNKYAKIQFDEKHGMHCVTTGPIGQEEELIRSPNKMLIPPKIPKLRKKLRQFTEKERLILRLIYEVRQGKKSKWHIYFTILPTMEELYHPIFWTSTEFRYLTNSYAYHNLMAKLKLFNKFYDRVVEANLFSPFVNMEELKWATSIVESRAFTIKKLKGKHRLNNKPFLAPLADMLNHDPETEVGWKLGAIDEEDSIKEDKTFFRIFTLRPYNHKGKQLMNNYNSALSSIDLLMNYGFAHTDPSVYDHLPLQIDIPKTSKLLEERKMIREFMNISNSIALHWNTPVPTDLINLVLIIQMTEDEVTKSVDEEKIIIMESEEHLQSAYELILGTLDNLKVGYSDTLSWDNEDESSYDQLQKHRIMYAKRVVKNEAKVLDSNIEKIKMLIDGEDINNNLHRNNNDEEDDDDDTSKEDL